MNHPVLAFALQEVETDNTSMWIILAVVLVILVFIVVIVGVGLTIFFIARKRSKAQKAASGLEVKISGGPSSAGYAGEAPARAAMAPGAEPSPAYEGLPAPALDGGIPERASAAQEDTGDFDPSRTVAISREPTVQLNFGTIKFVSGVLAGQEFKVDPAGSFIGRESNLSQIVITDPRISKRHLWIGVRDGVVTIVDQDSRNGTFVNDPRSDRVTETKLSEGDTVIMGESDVARFEFHE